MFSQIVLRTHPREMCWWRILHYLHRRPRPPINWYWPIETLHRSRPPLWCRTCTGRAALCTWRWCSVLSISTNCSLIKVEGYRFKDRLGFWWWWMKKNISKTDLDSWHVSATSYHDHSLTNKFLRDNQTDSCFIHTIYVYLFCSSFVFCIFLNLNWLRWPVPLFRPSDSLYSFWFSIPFNCSMFPKTFGRRRRKSWKLNYLWRSVQADWHRKTLRMRYI